MLMFFTITMGEGGKRRFRISIKGREQISVSFLTQQSGERETDERAMATRCSGRREGRKRRAPQFQ